VRFQPGNKFGKGRPHGSSYVQRCQEWAERAGWDMLIAWAMGREKGKNVPWPLRRYAVNTLMAYGFGRPREALEIIAQRPLQIDFSRITDEELHRIAGMTPD
jgi:hypothetical protein